ncbi:hypothetical protein D3C71_2154400 [compost metagenome]
MSENCNCGLPALLTHLTIKTKYEGVLISVHNVPVYECLNHHVKIPRLTRVKLTKALKQAYLESKDVAQYDSTE